MGTTRKATPQDKSANKAWGAAIILAFIIGFWFLTPFLGVIIFAALLAYIFNPLYLRINKWVKGRRGLAVSITTIASVFIVGIPLIMVIAVAITQGLELLSSLEIGNLKIGGETSDTAFVQLSNEFNTIIEDLTGVKDTITEEGVTNFVQNTLPGVVQSITQSLLSIVSGIPGFFMLLIIYLFAFTSMLFNQDKIIETVHYLSPFDSKVTNLYTTKMGAMAKAMVKGQFIIALCQGFVGALSLAVLGLSEYVLFFTLIFTVMNFIPLGSGLITIPLGLISIAFGNWEAGLVILGTHFIIVTNIDNVLRPILVPKEAKLSAFLTILAAFAGVAYFGFLGVIYGPIIMIVIVTTIETYVQIQKDQGKSINPILSKVKTQTKAKA